MLRSSPRGLGAALLASVLLAGCATLSNPFARHASADRPSVVEVRNDRWDDLTVYLEREGSEFRLGVVPGKGRTTLTVPDDYLRMNGWVRLVARTTGRSSRAISEVFAMGPGSRVSWAVPLTSGESPVAVVEPPL